MLLTLKLCVTVDIHGKPKVRNFDIEALIKQNIFWLKCKNKVTN